MVPAGEITEQTVRELGARLGKGDAIIDGGNTYFKDDVRRAKELRRQGHRLHRRRHERRRVGPRARLLPDDRRARRISSRGSSRSSRRSRPGKGTIADHARHRQGVARAGLGPAGLPALRPGRRRPLRQDGPQRHRVRPDAGLRRGLRPHARRARQGRRAGGSALRLQPRRRSPRCGGAAAWSLVAARPDVGGARREPDARSLHRPRLRTRARGAGRSRRRSKRRCRCRCWPSRCSRASARARITPSATSCSPRCASSSAATARPPKQVRSRTEAARRARR